MNVKYDLSTAGRNVSAKVLDHMRTNHVTRDRFAKKLGVTSMTLNNYIDNPTKFRLDNLCVIANELHITLPELFS